MATLIFSPPVRQSGSADSRLRLNREGGAPVPLRRNTGTASNPAGRSRAEV